jgi:hypothetical protein
MKFNQLICKGLFFFVVVLTFVSCINLHRKTAISIKGKQFYINGELTYKGRYWQGNKIEGLLFNSRMVQGIFDDSNPETRDKFIYPDTKNGMQTEIRMNLLLPCLNGERMDYWLLL